MTKKEGFYYLVEDEDYIVVYFSPALDGYMICGESELQPVGYADVLIPVPEPEIDFH
jgi:hypothetical protein